MTVERAGVPQVSVIIPTRNEERDIEACLRAIAAQDLEPEAFEVLIMDGCSSDRTVEVTRATLKGLALDWRVIENEERTTPAGLNLGLSAARGRVVCRVDARSIVRRDYLRRCVAILDRRPEIAVVGGAQIAIARPGARLVSRSIARGLANRFGGGLSRYRRGGPSGPTDTVYLGAFRTAQLRAVSGWSLDLPTNQDFDLNQRMRDFGAVWFEADLDVTYRPREDLRSLVKQYIRFGRWKVRYWRLRGVRPNRRQHFLLAAPPAAAIAVAVAWHRGPAIAAALVVGGSATIALVGDDSSAPLSERLGGVGVVILVAASWWWGVFFEVVHGH